MKTNLTKLLSLCFFLLSGYAALAQQDSRSVGESHAYTVVPENGSNTLAWTISGTQGTDWTAGALDAASVTVLWQKPGTYTMTFTETESHGGGIDCSTTKTLNVTVTNDFDVEIADATESCATGSTGTTDVSFTLTKTSGATDWTFDYTTTGLSAEITGDDIAVSGDTYTLTLAVPNLAAGADQTFSVTISDVKDNFGNNDIDAGNDATGNVTIYGVPNTGNITY